MTLILVFQVEFIIVDIQHECIYVFTRECPVDESAARSILSF
jgi:hypothetical protein